MHCHRNHLVNILIYAVLGFWSLVCVFPLYWAAVTSLKGGPEIIGGPFYLPFLDFTPSLGAWGYILDYVNDHLLLRFFNSAAVGLASTVLTVLLAGMAVYGLTRFRIALPWAGLAPGNEAILLAILATRVLPPVVVVLPIYLMARYTGTLDTRFVLIFTYTAANLPVAVWLLRPIFGNTATDQEEAAQLDGASHLQIFFTIFVPMVAAGLATAGLIIFILCWNEYLFAAYLTSTQAATLPPWMIGQMSIKEAQVGSDAEEWPQLSAATILMVTPLLAGTALAQRFLSRMALRRR